MLQLVSLVLVFVGPVLMQVVFVLVHDMLLVMIQSGMVQSSLILPVCNNQASIFWRSALRGPRAARGGPLWAAAYEHLNCASSKNKQCLATDHFRRGRLDHGSSSPIGPACSRWWWSMSGCWCSIEWCSSPEWWCSKPVCWCSMPACSMPGWGCPWWSPRAACREFTS